jgi:hypothetical protein
MEPRVKKRSMELSDFVANSLILTDVVKRLVSERNVFAWIAPGPPCQERVRGDIQATGHFPFT